MTGQAIHIGGVLLGGKAKVGSYRISDIIMSGVVLTGMGYIASGSNIFGFEDIVICVNKVTCYTFA